MKQRTNTSEFLTEILFLISFMMPSYLLDIIIKSVSINQAVKKSIGSDLSNFHYQAASKQLNRA